TFGPEYMPIGGLLSGFFGGLSGMQGALRSAFLARAGLSKEAFVATGSAIACLIDCTRLGVYATALRRVQNDLDYELLGVAILAAFAGAFLGNRFLKKLTMTGLQRLVAILLLIVALGLISGWL
ncbi:MAG: TSUP family transporter, partial [Gemmataceae bacterium]